MDLYDLQVGDRVRLADGTIAEVMSETEDGRSIRVRHIESPNNPSRAGSSLSALRLSAQSHRRRQ